MTFKEFHSDTHWKPLITVRVLTPLPLTCRSSHSRRWLRSLKHSRLADWTHGDRHGGGTKLLLFQPWKLLPLAVPTVVFDKTKNSSFRLVCMHQQCSVPGRESLWLVCESELEHGDLLLWVGCVFLDKLLHSFEDCAHHLHFSLWYVQHLCTTTLKHFSQTQSCSVSVEFLPAAREVENQTLQTHLRNFYVVSPWVYILSSYMRLLLLSYHLIYYVILLLNLTRMLSWSLFFWLCSSWQVG